MGSRCAGLRAAPHRSSVPAAVPQHSSQLRWHAPPDARALQRHPASCEPRGGPRRAHRVASGAAGHARNPHRARARRGPGGDLRLCRSGEAAALFRRRDQRGPARRYGRGRLPRSDRARSGSLGAPGRSGYAGGSKDLRRPAAARAGHFRARETRFRRRGAHRCGYRLAAHGRIRRRRGAGEHRCSTNAPIASRWTTLRIAG